MSPFRIEGPAVVSFSGGRTSGYMLRRILDEGLRPDVHVLFADTGKERPETYAFVRECSVRWGVTVHWVARPAPDGVPPFEQLISERRFLPNPVSRFCTAELKVRPMRDWMRARGYEHWTNVVGIRADEPRRAAKLRAPTRERWENALPLVEAGITERDVLAFWRAQPFDLQLRPWEGNCDLCFLKASAKRQRIMRERPDLAAWWIEQERRTGTAFRADVPSYAELMRRDACQLRLFDDADVPDCMCHEGTTETA
jgi:3'-phosphoadenosine 5'-phosphosulfate sulfotransferase (PAPS reductase)/FAD synthetase